MSKPVIVSIEGNIGSGKTTIIENLEKHLIKDESIIFLREPLDVWEGVKDPKTGENILQKFYADPEKYSEAKKFESISFGDVLMNRLNVMDMTAFTVCQENNLPIIVFNMNTSGNLKRIVAGEPVGTLVS